MSIKIEVDMMEEGKMSASNEIQELLKFMENSTDEVAKQSNSTLVQQLNKKVKEIKASEKAREEYMRLALRDMDLREEGRLAERIEIAKKLFSKLGDEDIAEVTGLSLEEVEKLKAEN